MPPESPQHLSYYFFPNPTNSLYLVAQHTINALREAGITVAAYPLTDILAHTSQPHPKNQHPVILHGFFYYLLSQPQLDSHHLFTQLSTHYRAIICMDVVDFDTLPTHYIQWASHPAITRIMIPSLFSKNALLSAGITTPCDVIPHGITTTPPSSAFADLSDIHRPKILAMFSVNPYRKGIDQMAALLNQFPECYFILKQGPRDRLPTYEKSKNGLVINDFLPDADLAALYHRSDLFLSLHRGGAFELHCLEAICHGCPVMATRTGGVTDYLTDDNAYLIDTASTSPIPPHYHINGHWPNADMTNAAKKMHQFLAEKDRAKTNAKKNGEILSRHYTWKNAAQLMINNIFKRQ